MWAGLCVDDKGHPKTGSTLADFLRYTYYEAPEDQRSELHSIAIQKTIKLTCPGDVHALIKFMPEDMIPHFVEALATRYLDDQIAGVHTSATVRDTINR